MIEVAIEGPIVEKNSLNCTPDIENVILSNPLCILLCDNLVFYTSVALNSSIQTIQSISIS